MCRVAQHKQGRIAGFTGKYRVHDLVWFELHPTMESAIRREKNIKEWRRAWKLRLIESGNPRWTDLFEQLFLFGAPMVVSRVQSAGSRPSPG
jgi:putative endonuclease